MSDVKLKRNVLKSSPTQKTKISATPLICGGVILAALLIILTLVLYPRFRATHELHLYADSIRDGISQILVTDPMGAPLNDTGDAEILLDEKSASKLVPHLLTAIDGASYSHKIDSNGGNWDFRLVITLSSDKNITLYFPKNMEDQICISRGMTKFYFDLPDDCKLWDTVRQYCS